MSIYRRNISSNKINKVVAVLLFVSFCQAASSKEADYQKEYESCIAKHSELNNMVIHWCVDGILSVLNNEINSKFKSLREMYSKDAPQDVEKLEKAQESWASYRDAQCELAGTHIGSPMFSICPMKGSIQRLKEINDLLQQ